MLSKKEITEIEKNLEQYPNKRAACIEALKIVQRHRRWISDENIADLGELLEMTTDELDNVATFYNLLFRKPVGKHVIYICDSITCYIRKYKEILEFLNNELGITYGETTPDDRFTLLPIACLGACDRAPVIMIDNDLHTDLTVEKLTTIMEKYT